MVALYLLSLSYRSIQLLKMKSVFFLAFLVSVSLAANIERDEPIYEGYSINNDGGNDLATLIANSNNFLDILNNLIDQNGLHNNLGGEARKDAQ